MQRLRQEAIGKTTKLADLFVQVGQLEEERDDLTWQLERVCALLDEAGIEGRLQGKSCPVCRTSSG